VTRFRGKVFIVLLTILGRNMRVLGFLARFYRIIIESGTLRVFRFFDTAPFGGFYGLLSRERLSLDLLSTDRLLLESLGLVKTDI
jgi:hypothetical protein